MASLTVDGGFAYNIPVMDLPTGTGTIVITATVQTSSGPVTVTRTWTYTKAAQTFPGSGGLAQLAQDGQNMFPLTLAEAVKTIGGPWGGNLSTALDKLAKAAVFNRENATAGDFADLWGNIIPTVKIETGSYVGTGGGSNGYRNKLTFSFEPKVVFINQDVGNQYIYSSDGMFTFRSNSDSLYTSFLTNAVIISDWSSSTGSKPILIQGSCNLTITGKEVTWRIMAGLTQTTEGQRNEDVLQLNHSGTTYNYVALG